MNLSDFICIGQRYAIIATQQVLHNPSVSGITEIIPVHVFTSSGKNDACVIIWKGCQLSKEGIFEDFKSLNLNCDIKENSNK